MNRSFEDWMNLARVYLFANAGRHIPGMTHNANNFCHVLEMQLELFQSKIDRQPDMQGVELLPKCTRLSQAVGKLTEILRDNEQFSFFTDETPAMIDLRQFMAWVDRFWTNNLFYKHKLVKTIACDETVPTLRLPPFILTLAIDESLKNAVEACQRKDPNGQHDLRIQITPHGQGAAFTLVSPTTFPNDLDPWQEYATTQADHLGLGLSMVRFFADQAGWRVDLATDGEKTTFRLEIPKQKTEW
jgi:phosphoglycerate-specific signal transduction histidine kinase